MLPATVYVITSVFVRTVWLLGLEMQLTIATAESVLLRDCLLSVCLLLICVLLFLQTNLLIFIVNGNWSIF